MVKSLRGESAQITISAIGQNAFSDLAENLAVDLSANLAVDASDDLAVRASATWAGATSSLRVAVVGIDAYSVEDDCI